MLGNETDWWRGAVIYQVYPRSFYDSNGDGVGDLPGLLAKLDYIASLAVDAIWISPFFTSPMKDFGYDVSDYRGVDPLFGTLDDLDRVVAGCHARGLKVLIDQVLNHTSDQHPWFQQSRKCRQYPFADWYVWADPKPDGSPPNNWLSVFGGSAWTWDVRRRQYYLHNFLSCQPDLNYHHPAVRAQILSDLEFWLARGIDGVRLDAINFCLHDHQLRDNPPAPTRDREAIGVRLDNPYAYQLHRFDKTQPSNFDWLRSIRQVLDRFPHRTSIGEIGDDHPLATLAAYTKGSDKLHMAYSFDLLGECPDPAWLSALLKSYEAALPNGWPCWATSNHDVVRVATRWGGPSPSPAQLRLYLVLLFTLRGSVCLYQGEELGLPESALLDADRKDPYGRAFWPDFKGRDGCRTPMPWENAVQGGFTRGTPWLPIPPEHRVLNVAKQAADDDSLLNFCRRFLAWRRSQPCLRRGTLSVLDSPKGTLCYERRLGNEALLVQLNLSAQPVQAFKSKDWHTLGDSDAPWQSRANDDALKSNGELPPWGFCLLRFSAR